MALPKKSQKSAAVVTTNNNNGSYNTAFSSKGVTANNNNASISTSASLLATSTTTTITAATITAAATTTSTSTTKATTTNINGANSISINPSSNHTGPFFFMYELPEDLWWRWPAPGTDCSENGYVGHEHAALSGMGTPINPDNGLFLTWHFSLFSSLFNRLKRSHRRTMDPDKASLFIVPYDLGLDGYLNSRTCQNSRRCTPGYPQRLQQILAQSKYFTRNGGADHAVLWSLGQYHPWPHNGCDVFMKDFCAKCTFTCYWMDPTKKDNRFVSDRYSSRSATARLQYMYR